MDRVTIWLLTYVNNFSFSYKLNTGNHKLFNGFYCEQTPPPSCTQIIQLEASIGYVAQRQSTSTSVMLLLCCNPMYSSLEVSHTECSGAYSRVNRHRTMLPLLQYCKFMSLSLLLSGIFIHFLLPPPSDLRTVPSLLFSCSPPPTVHPSPKFPQLSVLPVVPHESLSRL